MWLEQVAWTLRGPPRHARPPDGRSWLAPWPLRLAAGHPATWSHEATLTAPATLRLGTRTRVPALIVPEDVGDLATRQRKGLRPTGTGPPQRGTAVIARDQRGRAWASARANAFKPGECSHKVIHPIEGHPYSGIHADHAVSIDGLLETGQRFQKEPDTAGP
jgi:hypothetical protein